MDFDLSEEEAMLKASLERLVQDRYGLEQRRRYQALADGYDPALWQQLIELGLTALPFAEDDGGLGWDASALAVAMQQVGRGLMVEPYWSSVVFAGGIARHAGASALCQAIASGATIATVAHAEPQSRYALTHVATRAERSGDGWRLNGAKTLVVHGPSSQLTLVLARSRGSADAADGLSLFAVPTGTSGMDWSGYRTVDGGPAGNLVLRDVRIGAEALIGPEGEAFAPFDTAVFEARQALAAEAVGIMDALLAETIGYVKQRTQFGVPIGSFQVIQHRLTDCFVMAETARSLLYGALLAGGGSDPGVWRRRVAGLKAFVAEAGRHIGEECIQLHGGMGVTDELIISHYHKRLMMIGQLFGDAEAHWQLAA